MPYQVPAAFGPPVAKDPNQAPTNPTNSLSGPYIPTTGYTGDGTGIGEKDVYGNVINKTLPAQVGPPISADQSGLNTNIQTLGKNWDRGLWTGMDGGRGGGNQAKGIDKFSPYYADIRGQYVNQDNFHQAISQFDPGNPSHPTPPASSLSTYLQTNPGAVSWLLAYTQHLADRKLERESK